MLSEELLRLQLWDDLSGGLDAHQLLRDDAREEVKPSLTDWIIRSLRRPGPTTDQSIN